LCINNEKEYSRRLKMPGVNDKEFEDLLTALGLIHGQTISDLIPTLRKLREKLNIGDGKYDQEDIDEVKRWLPKLPKEPVEIHKPDHPHKVARVIVWYIVHKKLMQIPELNKYLADNKFEIILED
jgi:hypothetical protein